MQKIGSQALVAWLGAVQVGLGLWWLIGGTTARPLVIGMLFLCVGGLGAGAWSPIQMLKAPVYQEDAGRLALIGVVSWAAGPNNTDGCGGLTGVTPIEIYRAWIVETARKLGVRLPD